MAFLSKVGNILRQAGRSEASASSRPSIYQAIRCMSSSKVFVGGISYATDDTSLREAFSKYGEVVEARVILDRETGRSRGFGFVSFTSGEEAATAIQGLDGKDLHGRLIRVNYANERAPRYGGGGGGGYGGGGGGGWGSGGGGYGNNAGGGYGNYGGDNSGGRGGGGYGGNYGGGNVGYGGGGNYDGGNTGAFGSGGGGYSVAGGTGSSDSFGSGAGSYGVAGGAGDSFGSGSGYEGGNQFGESENVSAGDAAEGFGQEDALDSNNKDDNDDADDFAKRA